MKIQTFYLEEGARNAEGITVIIDVFRAFTLEPYLYAQGAEKIYAVGDVDTVQKLKKQHPEYICIGERDGAIIPGFDYGNSPSSIKGIDFTGKTILHTTTNGTRGMMNAIHASELLVGSFVNAKAIATYIKQKNPNHVSLVAMGWRDRRTEEDDLCARYLTSLLMDDELKDIDEQLEALRYSEGKKFFDPQQTAFPQEDFQMCIQKNIFPFFIKCERVGDIFLNRKDEIYA